jgi:hypothetical protein
LKEYVTQIEIEGATPDLRTGMTCEAEIMVARFDKTTYVPVQSVFMVKGKPTAFISKGNGAYEERPVEIGLDNNSMLQIASGLEPGESVLMTPPLDIAAVALETHTEDTGEESKFIGAREVAAPPAGEGGGSEGSGGRGEGRRGRGGEGGEGGEGGAPEGAAAIQPPADGAAASGGAPVGGDGRGEGGGERAGRGEGRGEGGGGWGADMSDEERAKMRERFQNMTPEEREKMREERMKNMTPEEREAWEQRRQERGNRDGQSQ